tara:strand:+ start:154 stop:342 length:189 start_codon:yes stop_codon:yes gene_type:complete
MVEIDQSVAGVRHVRKFASLVKAHAWLCDWLPTVRVFEIRIDGEAVNVTRFHVDRVAGDTAF